MKKLIFIVLALGLLKFIVWPQMDSYGDMGERRYDVLSRPAKEVVVGVCWPFSINQDGMKDGLQLAQDEINSGNLAGDYKIRLILRDNVFKVQKAKRIAVEFADTPEMSAVIGYYESPPAIKASAIFEASRLLHLIVGANNTAMTTHGFKYLVRTTLPSDKIARSLARLSAERGYKKIAVIWEENDFGEDLSYQYRVALDNLNIKMVYHWSYSRLRADFRLPVNELKGVDADAIFFAGIDPWAGDFLRNARGVGLKTPIIGTFSSNTFLMPNHAGPSLEGAMYYEMYNVDNSSPENSSFVNKFHARYGENPDTWAAQGYDALHILAKAIKLTGSRNPLDLSYGIRYMDAWEGANGRYKFNSKGDLEDKPIYLNMFQHGKSVVVNSSKPVSNPVSD